MKLRKWIGLCLTIVLCQSILISYCFAVNWQYETPWKNKMLYYIDTDSIQVIKKDYQIKFLRKGVAPSGYWYTNLILYNYKTKYFVILQTKEYDDHDKLIKSTSYDLKNKEYIETDRLMEIIINTVLSCKGMDREIIKSPLESK